MFSLFTCLPASMRRRRCRWLVFGLALGVLAALAVPASAQDGSGWNPGDPGVYAGYTNVTIVVTTTPGGVGGGIRRICVLADEIDPAGPSVISTIVTAPVEGHGYWVVCRYPADPASVWTVEDFVFYDPGDPTGGNVITPIMVREYALSLLDLGPPDVALSPPPTAQVVGVETWIGHPPGAVVGQARHAAAGPMWASAHATPAILAYEMGDGSPPVTCTQAAEFSEGTVPARPDCGRHTYQHSSLDRPGGTYEVRTTITYSISVATQANPTPFFVQVLDGETAVESVVVTDLEAVIH